MNLMEPRLILPLLSFIMLGACTSPAGAPPTVEAPADSAITRANSDGPRTIHLQDGGWMSGELQDGKRVGTWSSFFPDSTLRSRITYSGGRENGPTLVNHPNGMPYYVGVYSDGRNAGEWVFYDERGGELKRVVYDSTGVPMKQ
jgi:antitoxin component YwqK of YwqJK toxin-antitoxin module